MGKGLRGIAMPLLLMMAMAVAAVTPGCGWKNNPGSGSAVEPSQAAVTAPPRPVTIVLAATGDVLIHDSMIAAGREADGSYRFEHFFANIKPYIQAADVAVADFEGTMAGAERGYSGYPLFSCPDAMATALADTGFDVITVAGNHILDKGAAGAMQTVNRLEENGIVPVGAFRSAEERSRIAIRDVRGVKLAFLAYTYGTNGIPIPQDKPWLVNLLDEQALEREVAEARSLGADFVVASLHMGDEYQRQPSAFQKEWVDRAVKAGVDVVLGSHPHVLQPFEKRKAGEKDVFVVYSLGNFISAQKGRYRDAGAILYIPLEKGTDGSGKAYTRIGDIRYAPVWTDRYNRRGRQDYRALPVADALRDWREKADPLLTADDAAMLQQAWADTTGHLGPGYVESVEGLR
ncbi:CapA family protein [Heliobacterium undosum]|uniref:CapA family protein n=1 Tax=Heliomicrobium undosum TaxID=121734 RepID=A0A845L095_9FIRM|nr:CapA family protein [Heliomicrobium undosum]MZP28305.1 CapA family protein [Heliomicrobium undosum]